MMNIDQTILDAKFLNDIVDELKRARSKFPSASFSTIALMEEVGELAQAVLEVRAGKREKTRVWEEAVQVAVMAMRVAIEADPSLSAHYEEPVK